MSNKTNFLIAVLAITLLFIGAKLFIAQGGIGWFFNPKAAEKSGGQEMTQNATPLPAGQAKQWSEPPLMTIDNLKSYAATMKTSEGEIKIELFADETPRAVNNFIFLARQNFYDGLKFHRIIKNFMIQGGDPNGDGTGGPGYKFNDEKITRDYERGIVAYANSGPHTNGSQFFIMHKDTPLPKNYVIFGKVIEGMEAVDKIAETPTAKSPSGENSLPVKNALIQSVAIEEK